MSLSSPPFPCPSSSSSSLSFSHSPPCVLRGVSVRSDALGVQRSEDLDGPPSQGLRYPDSQHKIEAPLAKAGARVPVLGFPHCFITRKRQRRWCWRGARGAGFPFCVFMD